MDDSDDNQPPTGPRHEPLELLMWRMSRHDDRAAFARLCDRLTPQLCWYLRERAVPSHLIDGIVSTVLRELYRGRRGYVASADPLVWALALARELAQRTFPVDYGPQQEISMLAMQGLDTDGIARVMNKEPPEIRSFLRRARQSMDESLTSARRFAFAEPDDVEIPGHRMTSQLPIGRGGMGSVFEAVHLELGQARAIKVMDAEFARDARAIARFRKEAKTMTRIEHENVVPVYDAGVLADGRPWYSMKLLVGRTIAQWIEQQGKLTWPQTAAVARQICAGLAHVHSEGIVHCDIKPANFFVEGDQLERARIKLLDFGVARTLEGGGGDSSDQNHRMGTRNYMAPELFGGGTPDQRSDVYSAGVMLFEMLTGQAPFPGGYPLAGARIVDAVPARLDELAGPCLPREVQRIVSRAMARDPFNRYQSVVELADAIAGVEDSRYANAKRELRSRATRRVLQLASVSAAAASLITGFIVREPQTTPGLLGTELTGADFDAALGPLRHRISSCREGEPAVAPNRAKVLVLGATGQVIKVDLLGAAVDTNAAHCMQDALFDLRFPRFAAPQQTLEGAL